MIALLLACAPKVAEPPAPPPAAEPAPAPEVAAPLPPPGWRTGRAAGPGPMAKPIEAWSDTMPGPVTEPIATDGTRFYAVADRLVRCWDRKGQLQWESRAEASTGVLVDGARVAVGTRAGRVRWLDAVSGRLLSTTAETAAVRGVPVPLAEGIAWASPLGLVTSDRDMSVEMGGSVAGALAADGATVFNATAEGELVAATASGVAWRATLPAGAVDGPVLDDERVYVPLAALPGEPGGVAAFTRAGQPAWIARTSFGPGASPAVGDELYVPDKDGKVYALDRATGQARWQAEGFGEFTTQPLVVPGALYVGNSDGHVYRLDPFDGGVAWKVGLGAPVSAEPALAEGMLVVGLANGRVIALAEP